MRYVKVSTVSVREAGRCNACTDDDTETVTLVELRSLMFRLCDDCRATLLGEIIILGTKKETKRDNKS